MASQEDQLRELRVATESPQDLHPALFGELSDQNQCLSDASGGQSNIAFVVERIQE